ncbi:signaling mucin HKR1 [Nematostella vectensis]|uniref:signaling mucin HKR1 n=1 Tax=Nematostella vectensis TaxID=45351 RepID=UPI0020778502|nr:signaling mucin HKR1 [Nematostella vectensis]
MLCPLCLQDVGEVNELEFHYLASCPEYKKGGRTSEDIDNDVLVRFRWATMRQCTPKQVHFISSLAGSVALRWNAVEGMFESSLQYVPLGSHMGQLAVGDDLLPTSEILITPHSDVVYIFTADEPENSDHSVTSNPPMDENVKYMQQNGDDDKDIHGDDESCHDAVGKPNEAADLSPLYKELLHYQVSHGEPSWVPRSGDNSPVPSPDDSLLWSIPLPGLEDSGLSSRETADQHLYEETADPKLYRETTDYQFDRETADYHSYRKTADQELYGKTADHQSDREPANQELYRETADYRSSAVQQAHREGSPVSRLPGHISPVRSPTYSRDQSNETSPLSSRSSSPTQDNRLSVDREDSFSEYSSGSEGEDQNTAGQKLIDQNACLSRQSRESGPTSLKTDRDKIIGAERALAEDPLPDESFSHNGTFLTSDLQMVENTSVCNNATSPRSIHDPVPSPPQGSRGSRGSHSPARSLSERGSLADGEDPTPVDFCSLPRKLSASGTVLAPRPTLPSGDDAQSPPNGQIHKASQSTEHSIHPEPTPSTSREECTRDASPMGSHKSQVSSPQWDNGPALSNGHTAGLIPAAQDTVEGHSSGNSSKRSSVSDLSEGLIRNPKFSPYSIGPSSASGDLARYPSPAGSVNSSRHSLVSNEQAGRSDSKKRHSPIPAVDNVRRSAASPGSDTCDRSLSGKEIAPSPTEVSQAPCGSPRPVSAGSNSFRFTVSQSGQSPSGSPRPVSAGSKSHQSPSASITERARSAVSPRLPSVASGKISSAPTSPTPRSTVSDRTGSATSSPRPALALSDRASDRSHPPSSPPYHLPSMELPAGGHEVSAFPPSIPPSAHNSVSSSQSVRSTPLLVTGVVSLSDTLPFEVRRSHEEGVARVIPGSAVGESGRSSRSSSSPPSAYSAEQERPTTSRPCHTSATEYYPDRQAPGHRTPDRHTHNNHAPESYPAAQHTPEHLTDTRNTPDHTHVGDSEGTSPQYTLTKVSPEMEALVRERDDLARELRQRTEAYEAELRRLRAQNDDLNQQVITLQALTLDDTERERLRDLEETVSALRVTLQEKEAEITQLQQRCQELDKSNQELQDEEASLRTVSQLTVRDLNTINQQLQAEITDVRRKSRESSPRGTSSSDEISQLSKALGEVARLKEEKRRLQHEYDKIKNELETTKAQNLLRQLRLSKGDETRPKALPSGVVRHNKTSSSGVGSSHYSWSDNNYDSAFKVGSTNPHDFTDIYKSRHVTSHRLYRSSLGDDSDYSDNSDILESHRPYRDRFRTLSSESSSSSLLDYDPAIYRSAAFSGRGEPDKRRYRSYQRGMGSLTNLYEASNANSKASHQKSATTIPRHVEFDTSLSSYTSDTSVTTPCKKNGIGRNTGTFFTKPFAPNSPQDIQLGMRVLVTRTRGNVGRGVVKYVGSLPDRTDTYIGVELDSGEGKHDGSFGGKRFFRCKPNRGIFVSYNKVVMCYG